ncbi:hypothetical protein RB195_012813 [Necator americanus]|uniref:Uncharacterized protein n=1 Tax=Necator americanus TaxID=51031 RepID=A0ABR1DSN2_NECAM
MFIFVFFYALISLTSSQSGQHHWQRRPQPLSSAHRGFSPPSQRRLSTAAVVNALPTVRLNGHSQQLHPDLLDAKASENGGIKAGASIFAGNMSKEFLTDISDYIYGLMSGKPQTRLHRTRSRALHAARQSDEVLDYEDEAKARDAAEERVLASRRSMAVVQSRPRTAVPPPRPASLRRRPNGISRRRPANSHRTADSPSATARNRAGSRRRLRAGGVA